MRARAIPCMFKQVHACQNTRDTVQQVHVCQKKDVKIAAFGSFLQGGRRCTFIKQLSLLRQRLSSPSGREAEALTTLCHQFMYVKTRM